MRKSKSSQAEALVPASAGAGPQPGIRSGTVAQMVQMPVATLRVWERRYGLTQPELSPSGQRRYSADDVRRLTLIKQLTDLGHAIGSLAALDMPQLQRVAALRVRAREAAPPDQRGPTAPQPPQPPERAWRLAVVGTALYTRVHRSALLRASRGRPVLLLGPFDDAAQAAAALQRPDLPDALLIHAPQLHEGWLAAFDAAAPGLAGVPKAVLYGFAGDAVCEAMAAAGTALLREPQPDVVLAQWLSSLCLASGAAGGAGAAGLPPPAAEAGTLPAEAVPPRRWDDAALADFAGRLSNVACECPRHVTELLLQLAHFEAYSAECEHRNAADAALHAYLRQVAAASRAHFETALMHVALHEGLLLPITLPKTLPTSLPALLKPSRPHEEPAAPAVRPRRRR